MCLSLFFPAEDSFTGLSVTLQFWPPHRLPFESSQASLREMAASALRENVLSPVCLPYWASTICLCRDGEMQQCCCGHQQEDGWGGQAEHSSLLPASERVRYHWGEFRDGGEESRERGEKRQMVLPGDSCSSQSSLTVQAPVLFSLPPPGLLEGLSLSHVYSPWKP